MSVRPEPAAGGMMRIGELARRAGVETPTIRYYESVGVLPEPERNQAGYRTYASGDLERLRFVVSARSLGLRLDDIRETLALRASGETPCTHVRRLIEREVKAVKIKISGLRALARELEALQALSRNLPDTSASEPCICHIIEGGRVADKDPVDPPVGKI